MRKFIAEIDHVVIETGVRERVVGGAEFPAVNAKGIVASGVVCDGEAAINFSDLATGQPARRGVFVESAFGVALKMQSVRPLAWLSDGLTLFYEVSVKGESHPRFYFGRFWPLVQAKDETFVRVGAALHESGFSPNTAALVDDKTIAFAAGADVREWNVSTGRLLPANRGFELPETITALTVDPSGTHFLAMTRTHVLYRWSVGDAAPTKLAAGVRAAAWLR